jgi:hypothetical protein
MGVSIVVYLLFGGACAVGELPPPDPPENVENEFAFECRCECTSQEVPTDIDGDGLPEERRDQTRTIALDICLPDDASPEEYCRENVCPALAATATSTRVLTQRFCTTCQVAGVSSKVNAQECSGSCEKENCKFEVDLKSKGDPVKVPNRETCTSISGTDIPPKCDEVSPAEFAVCRPDPGTKVGGDGQGLRPPNVQVSGLFSFLDSKSSTIEFDDRSEVKVTVGSKAKTVEVSGKGAIFGEPCPSQSCEIGLSLNIKQSETVSFGKEAGPFSKDIDVSSSTLFAGSGTDTITLSKTSSGMFAGSFPIGEILGTFVGEIAGKKTGFVEANKAEITVKVDWDEGSVHVFDGFELPARDNRPKTSIKTDLKGTITNQPPVADAGPDQKLECASPDGTPVELDASASLDRDENVSWASWNRIPEEADDISDVESVANIASLNRTVETTVPLGKADFALEVFDSKFQSDFDRKTVEVVDTTPPEIKEFSFEGPPCLWPPNHKYAVLRVGRDFQGVIEDACDPSPDLIVRDASSDQPDNSTGDGDTRNDVVVFPDHVCLRKERQGSDLGGRTYEVELVARDDSGNENDPTVKIRVPHDQRPSRRCQIFEGAEVVGGGSEVCSPKAAEEAWEEYRKNKRQKDQDAGALADGNTVEPKDKNVGAGSACSAAGDSRPSEGRLLWLFVVFGIVRGVRRRTGTGRG